MYGDRKKMVIPMPDEMVETTAKIICSNCHDEIDNGSCLNCGTPFEHAGRVFCNGTEHYCEECYDEQNEGGE